ncbi:hypothetical protein Tco_0303267 [Tanacetum coccineum]
MYQNSARQDSPVDFTAPPPVLAQQPSRRCQKRMAVQNEDAPGALHGPMRKNLCCVKMSGAEDEDYFATALLDYEAEFGVPFTLRHC